MKAHSTLRIYTCFAATPARVLSLIRLLRANGGEMPAEEAAGWLHPVSLREGNDTTRSSQFTEIVAAATELGFLGRTGLGALVLSPRLQQENCPEESLAQDTARAIGQKAFALGDPVEPNGFAVLSAWWCRQDTFWRPKATEDLQQRLTDQGLDLDALNVRNNERWDMLRYWWRFLGLATNLRTVAGGGQLPGILPDATGILCLHLRDLLPTPEAQVPIGQFLGELGGICPALDGGTVSSEVAEMMGTGPRLTGALSVALARLEQRGVIRTSCPDDQREFETTNDGRRVAFVSRLDGVSI